MISFSVFLLLGAVLAALLNRAKAQNNTGATLSLASSATTVQVGQTFTVGVGLNSPVSQISGVDVMLSYNNTLTDVTDAQLGNTTLKLLAPQTDTGQFDLAKAVRVDATDSAKSILHLGVASFDLAAQQPTASISGNFDPATNPLAKITFTAKKPGKVNIDWQFDGVGVTSDSNAVSNDGGVTTEVLSAAPAGVTLNVIQACSAIDFNGNKNIDIQDIQQVAALWNTFSGDQNYNSLYDLDQNGAIDIRDIQMVAGRWLEVCP